MGDISEMILDGILCMQCGGFIDVEVVGYPRKCSCCSEDDKHEELAKAYNKQFTFGEDVCVIFSNHNVVYCKFCKADSLNVTVSVDNGSMNWIQYSDILLITKVGDFRSIDELSFEKYLGGDIKGE
ncbi:MAG: hypothetical protein ACRCX2_05970 [Paraclostridium sp.]